MLWCLASLITAIHFCLELQAKDLTKLQCVQDRLDSVVIKSAPFTRSVPLLRSLHWLPACLMARSYLWQLLDCHYWTLIWLLNHWALPYRSGSELWKSDWFIDLVSMIVYYYIIHRSQLVQCAHVCRQVKYINVSIECSPESLIYIKRVVWRVNTTNLVTSL